MNLSPRELKVFIALANTLSITEVAKQFFVTQPTMSKLLSNIEEKLGVLLFKRTTRTIKLTREGAELLNIARHILSDYESGLIELEKVARFHTQQIFVAALPTLVTKYLSK